MRENDFFVYTFGLATGLSILYSELYNNVWIGFSVGIIIFSTLVLMFRGGEYY